MEREVEQEQEDHISKVKALQLEFGNFVDSTPVFVHRKRDVSIPKEINGIERIRLERDIQQIVTDEHKAINQAQIYRDKCTQLEMKCHELKKETQAVRYFWLNGVIEGHSRGAVMLRKLLGL